MQLKNPVMIALDVDDAEKALKIARDLAPQAGGFKVGPRLVLRGGTELVKKLADLAPLFIDFKFYDIPSTMLASVRTAFELGASFVTVHAWAGKSTLRELAQLEKELQVQRPFRILAVTVLTSMSDAERLSFLQHISVEHQVERLAMECFDVGLEGIVCSPQEAKVLKRLHANAFLVTPGIRFLENEKDDQTRTATAQQALQWGASALVIGRPILNNPDPKLALANILENLNSKNQGTSNV